MCIHVCASLSVCVYTCVSVSVCVSVYMCVSVYICVTVNLYMYFILLLKSQNWQGPVFLPPTYV